MGGMRVLGEQTEGSVSVTAGIGSVDAVVKNGDARLSVRSDGSAYVTGCDREQSGESLAKSGINTQQVLEIAATLRNGGSLTSAEMENLGNIALQTQKHVEKGCTKPVINR